MWSFPELYISIFSVESRLNEVKDNEFFLTVVIIRKEKNDNKKLPASVFCKTNKGICTQKLHKILTEHNKIDFKKKISSRNCFLRIYNLRQ